MAGAGGTAGTAGVVCAKVKAGSRLAAAMTVMVCFFMLVAVSNFLLAGNWDEFDLLGRVRDAQRCAGAGITPFERLATA